MTPSPTLQPSKPTVSHARRILKWVLATLVLGTGAAFFILPLNSCIEGCDCDEEIVAAIVEYGEPDEENRSVEDKQFTAEYIFYDAEIKKTFVWGKDVDVCCLKSTERYVPEEDDGNEDIEDPDDGDEDIEDPDDGDEDIEDPDDGDEDIEDPDDGDEDIEDPDDGDEDIEDPDDDPVAEAQVAEAMPGEEIVIELKGVDRSPDSETVVRDVIALGVSVLREGLTYYLETLPEEGQITYPAEVSEADLPYQLSDRFVEYTAPDLFTENDSFQFSVSDEAGDVENRSIAKTVTIQPAE